MSVTNQQILTAITEVRSDVSNLKTTQEKQGKEILDILLRNAKKDGEETALKEKQKEEEVKRERRKGNKVLFWTAIAGFGTAVAAIAGVVTLFLTILPRIS